MAWWNCWASWWLCLCSTDDIWRSHALLLADGCGDIGLCIRWVYKEKIIMLTLPTALVWIKSVGFDLISDWVLNSWKNWWWCLASTSLSMVTFPVLTSVLKPWVGFSILALSRVIDTRIIQIIPCILKSRFKNVLHWWYLSVEKKINTHSFIISLRMKRSLLWEINK